MSTQGTLGESLCASLARHGCCARGLPRCCEYSVSMWYSRVLTDDMRMHGMARPTHVASVRRSGSPGTLRVPTEYPPSTLWVPSEYPPSTHRVPRSSGYPRSTLRECSHCGSTLVSTTLLAGIRGARGAESARDPRSSHAGAHADAHTHTHTRTHTHPDTHTHTHTHTHVSAHTPRTHNTHTHTHAHKLTPKRTHARTLSRTRTRTRKHTHTPHTRACACAGARAHTNAQIHARTMHGIRKGRAAPCREALGLPLAHKVLKDPYQYSLSTRRVTLGTRVYRRRGSWTTSRSKSPTCSR